jgi:hypothetical protein
MVGIAAGHPIRTGARPVKVSFDVTEKVNRLSNKPSGKTKRNSQWLTEFSPLCIVMCADGSEYTISRWARMSGEPPLKLLRSWCACLL